MDEQEFIPTRRTLLSRLKRWSDHDSWQEFFDTYWKLIYCVCLRYGLTHDEAQEIVQETRLYDSVKNETRPMRGKEEAHDYRYLPDPDLAPLNLDSAWIEELRAKLPDLFRAAYDPAHAVPRRCDRRSPAEGSNRSPGEAASGACGCGRSSDLRSHQSPASPKPHTSR